MKKRLHSRNTFYKFLFSYILILSLSLFGVFYIVNLQLKGAFQRTYWSQNEAELKSRINVIMGRMLELNQMYYSLQGNITAIMSRYDDSPAARITAVRDIGKYISGNSLVRDVLYVDTVKDNVLSASLYTVHEGSDVVIFMDSRQFRLPLDELGPVDYTNQLLRLKQGDTALYLYQPQQNLIQYQVLFILEENELRALLQACLTETVRAVALVNRDNQVIYGLNEELLRENPNPESWKEGEGLVLYPLVSQDLALMAYSDQGVLERTVSEVLRNSYYIMILIAVGGIALTILFMRLTYNPILAVIQKITGGAKAETDNLQSIVEAFDDSRMERNRLQQKIEKYRLSIQRSLMDSVAEGHQSTESDTMAKLDQLFDSEKNNCIQVVIIQFPPSFKGPPIQDYFRKELPQSDLFFILEQTAGHIKALFNYPGAEPPEEKEEDIRRIFVAYCGYGCRVAVSDSSSNPLDMARLYGNAEQAVRHLGEIPLVMFQDMDTPREAYPYVILDSFSDRLEENDVEGASQALDDLMTAIDPQKDPEFFTRCVLIDAVAILTAAMNRANIRFEKFSVTYYQAFYFCRSSDYRDTFSEIKAKLEELLAIYAQESESGVIQLSQIRHYIQENAFSRDFSVTTLADAFGINPAYMSYFFKKKTGANLTEYVWQLRLERSKELLLQTDNPIDQISGLVGYDNASSFRRKFKESVGMSPSRFRKERPPAAKGYF